MRPHLGRATVPYTAGVAWQGERAEVEPRSTRSCVLSGCLGSVYLALPTHAHTLSFLS